MLGRHFTRALCALCAIVLPALAASTAAAAKVDCEDLRAGCAALSGDDGYPGDYAYAAIDRSPDGG
jgi:hypothetical protein